MKKPECVVQLGRFGDIILMLPAFKKMQERTGVNPIVMVSQEYASVLDGVSYVTPWPVPYHWANELTKAVESADDHFDHVAVPAWWNSPKLVKVQQDAQFSNTKATSLIRIGSSDVMVDATVWPNYMASMWQQCGLDYAEAMKIPVVFDQRRKYEESLLLDQWLHVRKPTVLYNFTGTSSPFPFPSELFAIMREFRDQLHFVNLGEIKADRIYDLLGLYDAAVGLITIDTATLHLAPASKLPYIGITKEGWSGSVCKGNCVLNFKYGETLSKLDSVRRTLKSWVHQFSPRKQVNPFDPPSVLEQTAWPCKILETPREHGDFFNPGLVSVAGQDFLFTRRSFTPEGSRFSKNEIFIFDLKKGVLSNPLAFKPISQFEGEHLEDPRVFKSLDDRRIFLSCCNFVWNQNNKSTHTHQVLFEVDYNLNCLRRHDIPFIGNGSSLALNTRSEKNWLFFEHEGLLHLIYATQPHLVVMLDNEPNPTQFLTQPEYHWKYGEIRGGTPPVRIGDEYWSFFHSSLPAPEHNSRRYHMGAYAFEAKAPFKPTRVTMEPLLSGSRHDRIKPRGPCCVFPCGSLLRNSQWLVTFGVNDLDCATIEIPHSELVALMKNI